MTKKLVIYGAGGFGREVKSMLPYLAEEYELLGFLDDGLEVEVEVDGTRVLGGSDWIKDFSSEIYVVIAIGNPRIKSTVCKQLQKYAQIKFPTMIHSRAHLQDEKHISIGEGSVIGAGSVLTTGITLGKHVLINLNVTIGHDSVIGNFSSIMPGVNLSGNVSIGSEVMIGSGANVINKIKIGDFSNIGAGSVVNHDIPAASTAAGVPARVIK